MRDLGVTGAAGAHLSRAVGVWPSVPIDVILAKPEPADLYLLCSDGLTKMVTDDGIRDIVGSGASPTIIVEDLIGKANSSGGKDNITVIVIRVEDPATSPR
jgi:protein phosphatase